MFNPFISMFETALTVMSARQGRERYCALAHRCERFRCFCGYRRRVRNVDWFEHRISSRRVKAHTCTRFTASQPVAVINHICPCPSLLARIPSVAIISLHHNPPASSSTLASVAPAHTPHSKVRYHLDPFAQGHQEASCCNVTRIAASRTPRFGHCS